MADEHPWIAKARRRLLERGAEEAEIAIHTARMQELLSRPSPAPTAVTLADVARQTPLFGFARCFHGFLDKFCEQVNETKRQDMIDDAPASTSDRVNDAFLAAAAEHLAGLCGLSRPVWTQTSLWAERPTCFIEAIKCPDSVNDLEIRRNTPPPFAVRNLWTGGVPFTFPQLPEPDGYLLTPIGVAMGYSRCAVRGGYGQGADPYYAVFLLNPLPLDDHPFGIARGYTTITLLPPSRILLSAAPISADLLEETKQFIARNLPILIRHWTGHADSAELVELLR